MRLGAVVLVGVLVAVGPLADPAGAQPAGDLTDRAYRLGVEAAESGRSDPAGPEAVRAARYREVLALTPDEVVLEQLKDAFERGYRDGLAQARRLPAPGAWGVRLYDITPARDIAWGRPVGAGDVFTPDTNPIYVWFRHDGVPPGTTITSVWYFLGGASPYRVSEGAVTVAPPSDWGQFNLELAPGKRWPVGDYRVDLLVAGAPAGEARFRIATAPSPPVPAPPPPPAAPAPSPVPSVPPPAQRYTHPRLGFSLESPPGWTLDEQAQDVDVQMRSPGGPGIIQVSSAEAPGRLDASTVGAAWEARSLGPGKALQLKLTSRPLTVDGDSAYEGIYQGEGIMAKVVFVAKPRRAFVLTGIFAAHEYSARAPEFDRVVASFSTPAESPPPPAAPPEANPLGTLLEGLRKILEGVGQ